jgi:hypothetical protein
MCITGESNGR